MRNINSRQNMKIKNSLFAVCIMTFFGMGMIASGAHAQSDDMTYGERHYTKTESKMDKEIKQMESRTLDLLSRIDAFAEEDEQLRMDAAKAHYNMGNIYFQKGEYEIAAREYYQAVTLMPDDPDAHYNLAFVSGEHLGDYHTALKHYKMYLYLNPDAKDKHLINEKIVHTQLLIRNTVNSPLEKKALK